EQDPRAFHCDAGHSAETYGCGHQRNHQKDDRIVKQASHSSSPSARLRVKLSLFGFNVSPISVHQTPRNNKGSSLPRFPLVSCRLTASERVLLWCNCLPPK